VEQSYSSKKGISAGIIAGIIAGIVMLVPMMTMMTMMNLPSDLFPILVGMTMGQTQENAAMTGIVIHFIPSIIIGIIFGAAISISKLSIRSFKKGISLGLVAGIISFTIIFLPMMMNILPSTMLQLMQMMNPGAPQDMIMQQLQSMQPMLLIGSLVSHIIYGIVLGSISYAIVRKSQKTIKTSFE
jgi:ABC-type polysaccharide/polyol phosphate export permease